MILKERPVWKSKISMRIIRLVFLWLLCWHNFVQAQSSSIVVIDKYVSRIDSNYRVSISKHGSVIPDTISVMLAEGYITSESKTGGFSQATYHNSSNNLIYKIVFSDNLHGNINRSYYFNNEQLIYVKLELVDERSKSMYSLRQYFLNDILIKTDKKCIKVSGAKFVRAHAVNSLAAAKELLMDSKKNLH